MIIFNYFIPKELGIALIVIFGALIVCSSAFVLIQRVKPSSLVKGMILTTRSWWFMALGITVVIIAPPIYGTILIAYVSFVALREMFSISGFRESDRTAIFVAYFAIPIQYYLAYQNLYFELLIFIPIIMLIAIPFILVLAGKTHRIGRSMSIIPALLLLTVYMISHIVLFYHVEIPDFTAGSGGLILFVVIITSLNDVFQFAWGKLLGRHKILPNVSPNKTWEGFIGGVFSSAGLAVLIRVLTPLTIKEAFISGLILSIMGFIGDSVMSAIKRDLQIKDTDDLIPGHGGAMDRLDSLVVTAPIFYYLLKFFITH